MKKLSILVLFACCGFTGRAMTDTLQLPVPATEMDIYNGLIYAPSDMKELKRTADSLNLQFKQCSGLFSFVSWPQASAICIEIKKPGPLDEVIACLKSGASMKEIKERFGQWLVGEAVQGMVVYQESGGSGQFLAGNARGFGNLYTDKTRFTAWKTLQKGGWVYQTSSTTSIKGNFNIVRAWQLQETFHVRDIPAKYAKMISYVDCLVDTGTVLMLRPEREKVTANSAVQQLNEYVSDKTEWPIFIHNDIGRDSQLAYIREHYNKDKKLRDLTDRSIEEAIARGGGSSMLETIAAGLISKEKLLLLKRSYVVYGSCSMDGRPREQAQSIAALASQTHQWPVFIKAHLNIMNDYFERMSDGSYAQGRRKTYLKELESLNINSVDLLMGSVLRAANVAQGHYYGDVGRCGRALSETKEPVTFETKLKAMLNDPELDDFNRSLLFILYTSYTHNQPTKEKVMEKVKNIQQEAGRYPLFIQDGIRALSAGAASLHQL